ncbi:MAG TPA: hypothetical protein PKZ65_05405 [Methanoregulaceae archaeon]|nr:hypothetical protein [Methanoregulaceae archaeon]
MFNKTAIMILAVAGLVFFAIPPVAAATTTQEQVLYQATFTNDPGWTTNSIKSFYWVPDKGVYAYSIEPGNGGNAYVQVAGYQGGSFTLEYDVTPVSTPANTAFRLGFATQEMDRTKGTIALSEFTNAKYGRLMWIRAVTPSNRLFEVSSHANSYGEKTGAPTVNFVDNHTYHVSLEYDDEQTTLTMRVIDKTAIATLWSYYLNTKDPLKGMSYIVIGTVGDYSAPGNSATGYIDNVRLAVPRATTAPDTPVSFTTPPTITHTPIKTTVPPTTAEETPASPVSPLIPVAAAGLALGAMLFARNRNR